MSLSCPAQSVSKDHGYIYQEIVVKMLCHISRKARKTTHPLTSKCSLLN